MAQRPADAFTFDLAKEALEKVGFAGAVRCAFCETRSRYAEIVDCDNRRADSFFVEAARP